VLHVFIHAFMLHAVVCPCMMRGPGGNLTSSKRTSVQRRLQNLVILGLGTLFAEHTVWLSRVETSPYSRVRDMPNVGCCLQMSILLWYSYIGAELGTLGLANSASSNGAIGISTAFLTALDSDQNHSSELNLTFSFTLSQPFCKRCILNSASTRSVLLLNGDHS